MKIDISKVMPRFKGYDHFIEMLELIDSNDIKKLYVRTDYSSNYMYCKEETITKIVRTGFFSYRKEVITKKAGFYYTNYGCEDENSRYVEKEDLLEHYTITNDNKVISYSIEIHYFSNNPIFSYNFRTQQEAIAVATKITEILKKDFITIE